MNDISGHSLQPQREPSLRRRLGGGVTWNLTAAVSTQGVTLAVSIVLANLLGREAFGQYGIIRNTLMTLAAIAPMATGVTALKHLAEFRSTDKARAGRILALCGVVSVVMAAAAGGVLLVGATPLARRLLKAPVIAPELVIGAWAVFFFVMTAPRTGALGGLECYKPIAGASLISGALYLTASVAGTVAWELRGAVLGLVVYAGAQWLTLGVFLRRQAGQQGIRARYGECWSERRIMTGFLLPAALSGLTAMPAIWLSSVLLVRQPNGYGQMGLYAVANNVRLLVVVLPNIANTVALSLLTHHRALNNMRGYRRVFLANLAVGGSVALIGVAVIAILGPGLLRVFGKEFEAGYTALLILAASTVPEAIANAAHQAIRSRGFMWLSFAVVCLPRDLLLVVGAYWLVRLGACGLAASYAVAWTLSASIILLLVCSLGLVPGRSKLEHKSLLEPPGREDVTEKRCTTMN
jgi:O-antigen/teichoic acid export membrane protein